MLPVVTSAAKVSTSSVISNNIGIGTNNFLVQEPSPVWVPERSRYECAFNGIGTLAATHWHIFLAYSGDGTNWTNVASTPCLVPGAGAWDGNGQPGPYLYNLTGTNWLFFGGTPVANPGQVSMGVAFSTDGTNYTEYGSNPILTFGSTTNFYEPMVTMVGSTWLMLANADANGATGLGIYRFTAPSATGPWTFGPKVIAGTNDFAAQVQGGGLANLSPTNIWAFIDNNNVADNVGVRRGVSAYWSSNALSGPWQYVGDVLTHSANGDWDSKAMGTQGSCVTTNGQILLMYAAPTPAANQSIGAAILTTGFQPIATNGVFLATASVPEWVRISQEEGRQSGIVHVWSDAGAASISGLGAGPEDLWFVYVVEYDDGTSGGGPAQTYGWIQQLVYGSNPNVGTMVDQARIGTFTASFGTFLDIHVNQATHVFISSTSTTPLSVTENPSTAGTSLQPAITFNTNNVPSATMTLLNGKLATNGDWSGVNLTASGTVRLSGTIVATNTAMQGYVSYKGTNSAAPPPGTEFVFYQQTGGSNIFQGATPQNMLNRGTANSGTNFPAGWLGDGDRIRIEGRGRYVFIAGNVLTNGIWIDGTNVAITNCTASSSGSLDNSVAELYFQTSGANLAVSGFINQDVVAVGAATIVMPVTGVGTVLIATNTSHSISFTHSTGGGATSESVMMSVIGKLTKGP